MIPRLVSPARLLSPAQFTRRAFSTTMTTLQRQRLVVTRTLPQASQARLEKGFEGIDIVQWREDRAIPRAELLNMAKGADGILCLLTDKIDAEVLDAAGPQLKVVSTMSVGYDHVNVPDLEARKVALGITPGVLTEATADTTVLLVLAAARRLREGVDAVIKGQWGTWSPTWLLGSQLTDKTVGIVGLGRIGVAVAKRLQAFGVRKFLYQGTRRKEETEKGITGAIVEFSEMDRLLRESDVICICCALNDKTKNMFDYDAFSKMKETVVFVNTARGGIVDQSGLIRALKENRLGSVGLDVTVPEPLPSDSELLSFPNCIVLPHIGSGTLETRTAMSEIAIENVLCGMKGERLPFPHNA
ncbi:glyoxylate/hydroxypyruvate reductase [Entomortierella parvispora]|uniref:Glyoxylate/hydroxypyruvate reductase n=1 Tax=Entomortierella parvispora TaxID=205924 RepID=A0A9P3M1K4_9FUNG|nr:glyoxylate/hydroxypyruvate reductase [Entomortierella parvispora]